jgi:hypothetical protein
LGETFHLSSKHFSSLLVKKELFIFATDFLSLLLTKRLFALATGFSAFAHFFEIYTQKVKILARESCVWGGKKRNLHAKKGNFS